MVIIRKEKDFKKRPKKESGPAWILGNGEKIYVEKGHSLKSYADDYEKKYPTEKPEERFTWEKLAEYNWGTKVPEEINWFLKNEVGCYQPTEDGKNFRFMGNEGKDDPKTGRKGGTGFIWVPKKDSKEYSIDQTHPVLVEIPVNIPRIIFRVENEFCEPIPNVHVSIELHDESGYETKTDQDGFVEIYDKKFIPRSWYVIVLNQDDVEKNRSNEQKQAPTTDYTKNKKYVIKPNQAPIGTINEFVTYIIQPQRCIVDGHAHIENGSCAPLPPVWNKLPLGNWWQPSRGKVDGLGRIWFARGGGALQIKSTTEIGKVALNEIETMFGPESEVSRSGLYNELSLLPVLVIQMMDMEYAHLSGFRKKNSTGKTLEGQTIYHEDEKPWYIKVRSNGRESEADIEKVQVPSENIKTFSKWDQQYAETLDAMRQKPLKMMAMYHYEPRRWNYSTGELAAADPDYHKGPWNYPFSEIATPSRSAAFIGFKMYTPLGYKPLDERLPYLNDFYSKCASEEIPILVHCSPGGMITHEAKFYKEFDEVTKVRCLFKIPEKYNNDNDLALIHFRENYVHPQAWRKVLEIFPKLKLCLAHFGGELWESKKADCEKDPNGDWRSEILSLVNEYDNVYTDFSCWNLGRCKKDDFKNLLLNDPKLKDKILFGTDWYMTLLDNLWGASYSNFCKSFWDFFMNKKNFPNGEKLWQRFTFINPFKFYGFNNRATIKNIADFLKKLDVDITFLNKNLISFQRLNNDFDKICANIEKGE